MPDEAALLIADVYEAAGALRRLGEETAGAEGLTQARWQVLSVVSEEPLTAPQAARRLGVSRQNVQRVAHDLVALGLADLAVNPDHRSSPLLTPTPAGKDALARVTARAEERHRSLFADLPDEEIRATRASLRRLLAALDEQEGTSGRR
ncbi:MULTISPECIES: MarR family winged helix-turn-helix transcriptional regulator [unclassified Streptomyces]|uniref:MarR family winged helix-turn-helix transcriptional regulator n=1 Tax=unclassified Streptomyces TaxID=2593676 RepID=UPI000F76FCAD|nr:MarR family winged helix-turn-helix transcriptional regulator [Streptomyces sp. WAC08241]MYV69068.1 MarR family transcriptional regulator [Streptomyces sp. SID2131]RSS40806.1 MarR family transcriptional regulator [Streptomyces sp. WAC08241]